MARGDGGKKVFETDDDHLIFLGRLGETCASCGWRAYVAWLEARAANDGGNIDSASQEALRQRWYLGVETFRDRLLSLVDKTREM